MLIPALVSAMSVFVAGFSWLNLQAERQRSANLSAQLDAVTRRLQSAASAGAPTLRSAGEPLFAAPDAAVDAEQPRPEATAASPGNWRQISGNHRVSDSQYEYMRFQLPQNYPGLQSELQWSVDQMDQLFDLLIRQQREYGELSAGLQDASEAERVRSFADLKARQNAELSALLGSKYLQYEEYVKTQPERLQADGLRRVLESSGAPLRDDQVQYLTRAFVEERQRLEREGAAIPAAGSTADQRSLAIERILSDARSYLNDRQQQALQLQLETQLRFTGDGAPPPASFPLSRTR